MAPPKRPNPRQDAGATPGTYFLSLTVENIRCFGPPQTLDLSDGKGRHAPWTIILGENGCGKSTLLQCMASISVSIAHASELPVVEGESHPPWSGEAVAFLFRAQLRRASTSATSIATTLASIPYLGADATPRRSELGLTVRRFRKLRSGIERFEHVTFGGLREVEGLACFAYGSARGGMPLYGGRVGGADDSGTAFLDEGPGLRDPEAWLLSADYGAKLDTAEPARFTAYAEQVKNSLVRVLPEVEDLRIKPPERPWGRASVEAKTPDGWVRLRRLGSGYQSQIGWLVDFASRMFERYQDSGDPLSEPAVVLVDEIDLHMHPRWQREIMGYLAELCPKTQFIVTAHSPLIVQAAGGANVVLLRRKGDHVLIDNDPEVVRNWRVDQILTSELFGLESARPPQIEEPLKERREILAKARLNARDRQRLAELEGTIGDLPAGESAEDRRAMELLRRAAAKLAGDA